MQVIILRYSKNRPFWVTSYLRPPGARKAPARKEPILPRGLRSFLTPLGNHLGPRPDPEPSYRSNDGIYACRQKHEMSRFRDVNEGHAGRVTCDRSATNLQIRPQSPSKVAPQSSLPRTLGINAQLTTCRGLPKIPEEYPSDIARVYFAHRHS
jgi:hypothetical protein